MVLEDAGAQAGVLVKIIKVTADGEPQKLIAQIDTETKAVVQDSQPGPSRRKRPLSQAGRASHAAAQKLATKQKWIRARSAARAAAAG